MRRARRVRPESRCAPGPQLGVFLYECQEAVLTSAIVHASKILPTNRIPEDRRNVALDLVYDRRHEGYDPL